MAASTPSRCFRSDSDWTHSSTRAHASCRDGCTIVTLAEGPGTLACVEKFVIEGGRPLSGTVRPAGNKNGALPALAAALLTDQEVVVRNVPRIRDVDAMLALLERLGVQIEWRGENV